MGWNMITVSERGCFTMKFDIILANPPYLFGMWRRFTKKCISISKHIVVIVSPNAIDPRSRKDIDIRSFMSKNGIQEVTLCHDHFPGIHTNTKIAYHIFNITKSSNLECLNPKLSDNDIIELSIVNKIKSFKDTNGTLLCNRGCIGVKTTDCTIPCLHRVRKKGNEFINTPVNRHSKTYAANKYWFTNQFYKFNIADPIIELDFDCTKDPDKVYVIEPPRDFTLQQFKEVYCQPIIQFFCSISPRWSYCD